MRVPSHAETTGDLIRPSLLLHRLAGYAMPLCMIGTLLNLVTDLSFAPWLARPALVVYLLMQARHLSGMARVVLVATVVGSVVTVMSYPEPVPLLLQALDRFCFFATFMASLSLLRLAALRSRLIREAGHALIHQKPSWRYPAISLGTMSFGIILNIGALSLFGTMIQKGNTLRSAGGDEALRAARERRMILAMLRGFALTPLTSPLGIAVVVLLSSMPQLTWPMLLPLALPIAAVMMLTGWWLDWWQGPPLAPGSKRVRPSLRPLARFSLIVVAITATALLLSPIGNMGLPVAVLIACPACAFVWLASQRTRLAGGTGTARAGMLVWRRSAQIFAANRSEIVILGGSAFVGALITPWVNIELLNAWLVSTGLQGLGLAVAAMFLTLVCGQFGLNPIISVTLILSLLPDPQALGLAPEVLAVALMSAWTLSMMSSPFTTILLMVSNFCGRSPYFVAWRWNGLYYLLCIPLIIAVLAIGQALLG